MGRCRLLYFVKSKLKIALNARNHAAVLLCFYVNTFILLHFLRLQEGHPPKSATEFHDFIWGYLPKTCCLEQPMHIINMNSQHY